MFLYQLTHKAYIFFIKISFHLTIFSFFFPFSRYFNCDRLLASFQNLVINLLPIYFLFNPFHCMSFTGIYFVLINTVDLTCNIFIEYVLYLKASIILISHNSPISISCTKSGILPTLHVSKIKEDTLTIILFMLLSCDRRFKKRN